MIALDLNGSWKLYYFPQGDAETGAPEQLRSSCLKPVNAIVPGNVELDLVRAGLLPEDLYFAENIRKLREYETYEYWYEKEFETPEGIDEKPVKLVFEGTDCIADYWLNGEKIGHSENMLIEHEFDVTGRLKAQGNNILYVNIKSAVIEAANKEYDSSVWALSNNWEQLWIRKAAHSYGWDIMPRVVSAGLWRGVKLVCNDEVEISDLHIYTYALKEESAILNIDYKIKAAPDTLMDLQIRVLGCCSESTFEQTKRLAFVAGELKIEVINPKLWWPVGYGNANLYDVTVQILYKGNVVASRCERIGIRIVELITRDNALDRSEPGEFLFKINRVPIVCKGSNWVPADAFHSRDAGRYHKLLQLFREQNCNILRCWGGNVYEDHEFFRLCDEYGIMVWQDFALACACYPQTAEFYDTITHEAAAVVKKLRNHPSIVLWCGDNECDEFYYHRKNLDPANNKISREILPAVLFRYDPYRPYIASSPYYSPEVIAKRDLDIMPEQHLWDFRDYYKNTYFSKSTPSFISEWGYIACPGLSSIKRFIDEEHLWPWKNNRQWLLHATEPTDLGNEYSYRIEIIEHQIKEMFAECPENLEDFILASQIAQAEAFKFMVEMTRLDKWRRTGIIVWNMIDGWPQFSDSIVDYYFGKKLAYYFVKRVQEQVCIMFEEPRDGYVRIIAGNDSLSDIKGDYKITDADSGEILLQGQFSTTANENSIIGRLRVYEGQHRLFLIEWTIDGNRYGNHYLMGHPAFSLEKYKEWLKKIASLQSDFSAEEIGK